MMPVSMRALALAAALAGFGLPAAAAELTPQARAQILSTVERNEPALDHAALEIWKFAELGYQETQSTALLQGQLRDAGFTITPGIAGEPTAFLASFRTGDGPVIAVLAEYDALPGLSQTLSPVQQSAGAPGRAWLRPQPVRRRLGPGGHRRQGLDGRQQHQGRVARLWHARRGGRIGQGLYGPRRPGSTTWTSPSTGTPGDVNSARQGDTMANVSGQVPLLWHGRPPPPPRRTRAARPWTRSRR